jgi:hypothetical protein
MFGDKAKYRRSDIVSRIPHEIQIQIPQIQQAIDTEPIYYLILDVKINNFSDIDSHYIVLDLRNGVISNKVMYIVDKYYEYEA